MRLKVNLTFDIKATLVLGDFCCGDADFRSVGRAEEAIHKVVILVMPSVIELRQPDLVNLNVFVHILFVLERWLLLVLYIKSS